MSSTNPDQQATEEGSNPIPTGVFDENTIDKTQSNKNEEQVFKHPNAANIFGLIDSLATKIPTGQLTVSPTSKSDNVQPPVRRTSDLLDSLQKALLANPPPSRASSIASKPAAGSVPIKFDPTTHFPVCVDIRRASNVTKIRVCVNKNRNSHQNKSEQCVQEQDASTYITFEGHGSTKNKVNSPDGLVFTTQVAEHTSHPVYNSRFCVGLPVGLLQSVRIASHFALYTEIVILSFISDSQTLYSKNVAQIGKRKSRRSFGTNSVPGYNCWIHNSEPFEVAGLLRKDLGMV